MEFLKNRLFASNWKNFLFWIFIILYVMFLLHTANSINISEDETYTLNTTSRNVVAVIRQSYLFEFQSPGYFVLLSFWRLFNSGIFFAKLFSMLSIGVASIYIYKLSNLFLGKKNNRWLIIIFLLNPFTVWAALEIRLYAFAILLSTVCIYLFYRYIFEGNKVYLRLFLISALISVYTQYFFVLLIITLAVSSIFLKGWKYFLKLCFPLLVVAVLFLPNLLFLPDQLKMQTSSNGINSSNLISIIRSPQTLILAINYVTNTWQTRIIRLLFLLLFAFSVFRLYRNRLTYNNRFYVNFKLILLSVFLLIGLFFIVFFSSGVGYTAKYMAVAFPFFILLFTIFSSYSGFYRTSIYSVLSLYFGIILFSVYRHPVNTYDYISLAKYIKKIERSNEPILIYRPAIALPFTYYYRGINSIVPLPFPVKFDSSYLISIKDTTVLKNSIESIQAPSHSYILISDTTLSEGSVSMNRNMVTNFIKERYHVTLDTLFYGWSKDKPIRIRSFEKK